jgi:uroporphyrinogen decarboxylase
MTPRDRVLAALAHEQPDRVPIVIGTSNTTGIKMGACRRLKAHPGITAPDRCLYGWPELGAAATSSRRFAR